MDKKGKAVWKWIAVLFGGGFGCAMLFGLILAIGYWFWSELTKVSEIPQSGGKPVEIGVIDAWIAGLREADKFNGGVLIARKGHALLMKTYGSANPEGTLHLTNQSSFRLASVSKHFTAMAIMILKEDGKLDFDDQIAGILPEISWEGVTIRHLLNHTSGAPDYMSIPSDQYSVENPLTIEEVIEYIGSKSHLSIVKANSEYAYSNTGYVLLAGIVQRVSGLTFEAFLSERIFAPLGMNHSRVWNLVTPHPDFPTRTEGFIGRKMLEPGWLDGVAGDGGVFVSLEDFLIWDRALRENAIVSAATMQEALTEPTLEGGERSQYGFGWVLSPTGKSHFHNGAWLAAGTFVFRNPEREELLVILDNSGNALRIDIMAAELIEALRFEK